MVQHGLGEVFSRLLPLLQVPECHMVLLQEAGYLLGDQAGSAAEE